MNIVYASNDNYVRHLAVSMLSVFDRNRRARQITVYVISIGLSGESRARLESIAAQYGRELYFVELADIEGQFAGGVDTGGFDISTLGRLFVGRLLPADVDRVLYLDCDTVAAQPLMELWRTDLRGNVLGAVMEPTIYQKVRQEIGLAPGEPYFNAGVLLIDLKRWRQTEAERRLLEFYQEKGGNLFACDQDVINGVLKGHIRTLLPKYNFFPNYRYFRYADLVKHEPAYAAVKKEAFAEAGRHPVIIHYAGDERPWYAGNLNHYRKAYEHYLALTPWAGTPKEEGRRFYLFAYHMMDYLTVVCPAARWFISRMLGMRAVAARGKKKTDDREGK